MPIRSICVYCGAHAGHNPNYAATAARFGELLAHRELDLIYGGGNIGLMGVVADAALRHGSRVTGIIPHSLADKELAHLDVSELIRVDSMHERKLEMANRADAFVALPGGIGTLEELFEVFTWQQLGFHSKPIGLLDVDGYYRPLLDFLDGAVQSGFLRAEHRQLLITANSPEDLLEQILAARPEVNDRWYDHRRQT